MLKSIAISDDYCFSGLQAQEIIIISNKKILFPETVFILKTKHQF
jgi:hypothetical protein